MDNRRINMDPSEAYDNGYRAGRKDGYDSGRHYGSIVGFSVGAVAMAMIASGILILVLR